MASNRDNGILLPESASIGGIAVVADFQTGLVTLTVTMPFAVEPIVCRVPIVDYLESAAEMTKGMCQLQRAAASHRS